MRVAGQRPTRSGCTEADSLSLKTFVVLRGDRGCPELPQHRGKSMRDRGRAEDKPRTGKDGPKTAHGRARDGPRTGQRRPMLVPKTAQARTKDGPRADHRRAKA